MSTDLDDRYGRTSPWRRTAGIAFVAVVAVVSLVWLAWAAWFHSTPDVKSTLIGYNVESPQVTTVRIDVELADGVEATCRVRALAEDHTAVGELGFTPVDGTNEVVVRTEREATSVEKIGCTSADQTRPQ